MIIAKCIVEDEGINEVETYYVNHLLIKRKKTR